MDIADIWDGAGPSDAALARRLLQAHEHRQTQRQARSAPKPAPLLSGSGGHAGVGGGAGVGGASNKAQWKSQPSTLQAHQHARAPLEWLTGRRYAVVVDAGSSGSRMQVYSWKDARVDRVLRERKGKSVKVLPTVEKGTWEGSGNEWQLKVEPGLSSFGTKPDQVGEYLKPLFDHAASIIPPSAMADTPVYVLATAGMRLLPAEQRDTVLAETCKFISSQTPFKMPGAGVDGGCSDHVQVISGEEEGLLGWIAINYLMDGFHFRADKQTTNQPGLPQPTEGRSTFGFLDMGGASTQIAFEPSRSAVEEEGSAASSDLTDVRLRLLDGTEVTHNVFVTTFLGFGTNKARDRYVESLVSNATAATAAAASSSASAKAVANSSPPISDPCLPSGLSLSGGATTPPLSLVGTGSFTSCLSSLSPLLDKDAACSRPPCLFHGVHVPRIDFSVNHFIGVSEYWFSSNDIFGLGGVYDFVSFQKAAQDFCRRPWSDMEQSLRTGSWGKQVDENRLQLQCFKAAWMTTVLHEGIGLPRLVDHGGKGDGKPHAEEAQNKADEKNLFRSVNDVDGLAVSWTLGKAVLEASREIPPPAALPGSSLDAGGGAARPPGRGSGVGTDSKGSHLPSVWLPDWGSSGQGVSVSIPPIRAGGHTVSGVSALVALLVLIVVVGTCCVARGRRASRHPTRRFPLRDVLPPPFGSCGGLFGTSRSRVSGLRGEYVLANRDERAGAAAVDMLERGLDEGRGDPSGSSSEEIDPKGATIKPNRRQRHHHHHHHRKSGSSSGGGILSALLAPIGWAGQLVSSGGGGGAGRSGRRESVPLIMSHANGSASRLRSSPPGRANRLPLRRNTSSPHLASSLSSTTTAVTRLGVSRPTSPVTMASSISRPASRAAAANGVAGVGATAAAAAAVSPRNGMASVGLGPPATLGAMKPLGSPALVPPGLVGAAGSYLQYRAHSPAPAAAGLGSGAGGLYGQAWMAHSSSALGVAAHRDGDDDDEDVTTPAGATPLVGPSRAVSPAIPLGAVGTGGVGGSTTTTTTTTRPALGVAGVDGMSRASSTASLHALGAMTTGYAGLSSRRRSGDEGGGGGGGAGGGHVGGGGGGEADV